MKIAITITDVPEGHDPHDFLRSIAQDAGRELQRLSLIEITPTGATIIGEPWENAKPVDF